ncbi:MULTISPECIES: alpha/beta hydrolase [unclassified Fibrobacter]|uniref:alpha/beta hydrolase n=1 Tax=unclassified Fibrobacter TaxID=2634177 RepID=UPI0025B92120|nr:MULTISPECIES: alpha/beta hydrolase [unclassified Fibrobacter]
MIKAKILIAATLVALLSATSANACLAACKEKKRDEAYSRPLTTSALQTLVDNSLTQKSVDPELGAPYTVYPIEVKPYDKVFHSTLIEYPFGSSPRAVAMTSSPRGIILYVHGYNDYFFQEELAEKSDSAGFAFFAIDLHYNGRSYRAGEPRSDMRSVKEYYAELDAAVALSKKIAGNSISSNLPFVIIAHSNGGLITPNYLNERNSEDFAAFVLNSPFLDYKNSWFVRNVAFPVLSDVALLMPDAPAPKQESPKYNMSLLKTERGEWEFNTELKSAEWPQQYFGFLRATTRGIKWIHNGMQIKSPILMMRSGCTVNNVKWEEDYMRCDCLLDVNLLEKWAPKLGPDVTTVTVEDGMHDVFLSRKEVRDFAYRTMFEFLDDAVARKNVVVAYNYILPR